MTTEIAIFAAARGPRRTGHPRLPPPRFPPAIRSRSQRLETPPRTRSPTSPRRTQPPARRPRRRLPARRFGRATSASPTTPPATSSARRELVNRPVRETFLDPRLAEALLRCLDTGEPVQSRVVLPQQTSPRGDLENRGVNAWIIDAARLPTPSDGGSHHPRHHPRRDRRTPNRTNPQGLRRQRLPRTPHPAWPSSTAIWKTCWTTT